MFFSITNHCLFAIDATVYFVNFLLIFFAVHFSADVYAKF